MAEAPDMNRVRTNIVANFLGSGWSALLGLALVPFYIRLMGVEAYGLIGFYVTLQSLSMLLDFGLSPTMNRELARYSAQPDKAQEARDLVRTLEVGYWLIGGLICVVVVATAPYLAHDWIKADKLPANTIRQAVSIMGLLIALQWPLSFYGGGLQGLQRQMLLNCINAGTATLRGVGAILILWFISPSIVAFFSWQIATSIFQTLLTTFCLWRNLPDTGRPPRVRLNLLLSVWRFAAGMSGISLTALVLTQLDKVILSRLLSLEIFGYYILAGTVSNALSILIGPVFTAVFPRLSSLVVLKDERAVKQLYHRSCQLMSVVLLPTAMVAALFSQEALLVWTGDAGLARQAYLIVSLLTLGTALNGLMTLPHALQLAYGWTKLAFYTNVVAILVLGPILWEIAPLFGAIGAAAIWVALNSGYVLIQLQFMHRRLLPDEQWRWYLQDVGLPLVATLGVVVLGRFVVSGAWSRPVLLVSLATTLSVALAAAAFAAPQIRAWLWTRIALRALIYGDGSSEQR
jgi:O-antigen/teichoic acid export membrane protein